jgi:ABC-type enterochelin transport system permease subunit
MLFRLLIVAAIAALVVVVVGSLPDIKRYLEIRQM